MIISFKLVHHHLSSFDHSRLSPLQHARFSTSSHIIPLTVCLHFSHSNYPHSACSFSFFYFAPLTIISLTAYSLSPFSSQHNLPVYSPAPPQQSSYNLFVRVFPSLPNTTISPRACSSVSLQSPDRPKSSAFLSYTSQDILIFPHPPVCHSCFLPQICLIPQTKM